MIRRLTNDSPFGRPCQRACGISSRAPFETFHTLKEGRLAVDYGFVALADGSEVRVVLAEAESEHGPQASTVQPIGKHRIVE